MSVKEGMAQAWGLPPRLVDLCISTYETVQNFKVLTEKYGIIEFRDTMNKDLIAKGWPVATDLFQDNAFPIGIFDRLMIMPGWLIKPDYRHWCSSIAQTLKSLDGGQQSFFTDEKRLDELQDAIGKATEHMKQKYGDPATVKRGTRSIVSAVFNAIAAKFTKETPETKLYKGIKDVLATAESCKQKDVSSFEAGKRAAVILKTKGWSDPDSDEGKSVGAMFRQLAAATLRKTSARFRYELQDENYPPNKQERAAKDFLLAHPGDFAAALKEAIEQLETEKAANKPQPPKPV
jgi:hypothetical protein